MTTSLARTEPHVVDQKADAAVEAEVDRLLVLAEVAAQACEAKDAARAYLGIAALRSKNAGLDKRRPTTLSLEQSVEDWLDE